MEGMEKREKVREGERGGRKQYGSVLILYSAFLVLLQSKRGELSRTSEKEGEGQGGKDRE